MLEQTHSTVPAHLQALSRAVPAQSPHLTPPGSQASCAHGGTGQRGRQTQVLHKANTGDLYISSTPESKRVVPLAHFLTLPLEAVTLLSSSPATGGRRPQLPPPNSGMGQSPQTGQAAAYCRQEGTEQDRGSRTLPLKAPQVPKGRCRAVSHARLRTGTHCCSRLDVEVWFQPQDSRPKQGEGGSCHGAVPDLDPPNMWAGGGRQGGSGSISPLPRGTEALEHSCISQKATTMGFKTYI